MPHAVRIALVATIVLAACSDDTATIPTTTTPTTSSVPVTCPDRSDRTDVPYVDDGDDLPRLDLYVPDDAGCEPMPLVVWVHGGGWSIGDKRNGMEPKVALWNAEGWAVASVNYRLTDADAPEADRIVAPTHNEDVATALAWLVDEAAALGIDEARIAVLGHSAGAGIVAAVASDPAYLDAHDLDPSAIACSAPLDTEAFDVAAAVASGRQLAELYQSVFGTDPDAWPALSPITHLGEAPIPDAFLVTRGTAVRRAQVAAFADRSEAAGGSVTIVDLPAFSHADVNQRIGDPDDDQLTPALQRFLTGCLEAG